MKQNVWGNLTALFTALCLVLSGCALLKPAWHFEVETRRVAFDRSYAKDGTLLAGVDYELPHLKLEHDALAHSNEPPEAMAAARDAFNDEMERYLRELPALGVLRTMAADGKMLSERSGFDFSGAYLAQLSVSNVYRTQRLVSVCVRGEEQTGGAHPTPCAVAWNYDLKTARFLVWGELTDRPDEFREKLAEEIGAQLEASGGSERFFPDWMERLGNAQAFFAENGLHLVFPVYEAAPFSEGTPEFTVPYEGLSPYWNAYGRELLKKDG